MKKPKIVFCIESLACGGAEKSLLSLLNNINQSKYDIDILVNKSGGEFEKLLPDSMNLYSIGFKPNLYDRFVYKYFRMLNGSKQYHNAQLLWKSFQNSIPPYAKSYDIAIAWGQGFATYYTSKKVNADKKFAWINTDYEKAGYYWKQDFAIYEEFTKIIGISDHVRQSLGKFLPNHKLITIRNIIDPDEIRERGQESIDEKFDPEVTNIVSVGRLVDYKGFHLAIDAIRILKNENYKVHLYIIGDGAEKDNLETLTKENAITDQISILGFRSNPYPYIKNCDIYLQSSLFEGLGRTVIEASILCKPIVTTNFPTAFSIINNNRTGIIVNMDGVSIAQGLKNIMQNDALKNKLIKNLQANEDKEKEKTLKEVYELLGS